MSKNFFFCLALPLLLAASSARGDEPADKAAIHQAVQSYVAAFNAADAAAVAEHWADDAEYLLPSGERVQGRQAIRAVFEKLFSAEQPPKIDVVEARIRKLAKDVAMEEGSVRMIHPDDSTEESSYLAIHVRQGEEWKLSTVRETDLPAKPEVAAPQQLEQLAWLEGQWQEGEGDRAAFTNFNWAKNRSFLTCQFRVPQGDGEPLEGTQVIGWDPISQVIRSWMFDSHGGFGEGVWSRRDDGVWSVRFAQVLPDGRLSSVTNLYVPRDDNSFEWKSIDRSIDGESVADIGPIRATRRDTDAIDTDETSSPESK